MSFLGSTSFPFLSLLISFPFLGILFLLPLSASHRTNLRQGALWIQGGALLIAVLIAVLFVRNAFFLSSDEGAFGFLEVGRDFQFLEDFSWIKACFFNIVLGVDLTSLVLILLVALTAPLATKLALREGQPDPRFQAVTLLALEGVLLGALCSLNIVMILLFSELAFLMFLLLTFDLEAPSFSFPWLRLLSSGGLFLVFLMAAVDRGSFSFPVLEAELSRGPLAPTLQAVLLGALLFRRAPWQEPSFSSSTLNFLYLCPLFLCDVFITVRFIGFAFNKMLFFVFLVFAGGVIISRLVGLAYKSTICRVNQFILSITMGFIYITLCFQNYVVALYFVVSYVLTTLGETILVEFLPASRSQFRLPVLTFLGLSFACTPFSLGFVGHVEILHFLIVHGRFSWSLAYLLAALAFMALGSRAFLRSYSSAMLGIRSGKEV